MTRSGNTGQEPLSRTNAMYHNKQTIIGEMLTVVYSAMTTSEQWPEKTHAIKQAMMQELLTGKTRLV